jgi:hypothetical protein
MNKQTLNVLRSEQRSEMYYMSSLETRTLVVRVQRFAFMTFRSLGDHREMLCDRACGVLLLSRDA